MPAGNSIRSRDLTFRVDRGISSTVYQGKVISSSPSTKKIAGRQITVSEGHPWFSHKSRRDSDVGGAFRTSKQTYNDNLGTNVVFTNGEGVEVTGNSRSFDIQSNKDGSGGSINYRYFGPVYPTNPTTNGIFPDTQESSTDVLTSLGTTAIARCKPTNSIASLSVALGELRKDGLPSLPGTQFWKEKTKKALKTGSSEYLNLQFGWLPLLDDINNVVKATRESDKILEQYRRDAGRPVRRRYEFPSVDETSTLSVESKPPYYEGINTYHSESLFQRPGTLTHTRRVQRRRWFSGSFVYHIPIGNSQMAKFERHALEAKKLYGLTLTPEVLWNLAPWSWAADWFFNTGDILSNVSDAVTDGLVLRYGYMMEHSIITDTYSHAGHDLKGVPRDVVFESRFITETKKRIQATPYGFGLNWDGFSPFQLSIIAALGLSRHR